MIKNIGSKGKFVKKTAVTIAILLAFSLCACGSDEDIASIMTEIENLNSTDSTDSTDTTSVDNGADSQKDQGLETDDYHSLEGKKLLGVTERLTSSILYGETPCKNGRVLLIGEVMGAGKDSGAYTVWGENNIIIVDGDDTFFADDCENAFAMGEVPDIAKGDYNGDGKFEYAVKNSLGRGTGTVFESVTFIIPDGDGVKCVESNVEDFKDMISQLVYTEVHEDWMEVFLGLEQTYGIAVPDIGYGKCTGFAPADIQLITVAPDGVWLTAVLGLQYEEMAVPDYDTEVNFTARVVYDEDRFGLKDFELDIKNGDFLSDIDETLKYTEINSWSLDLTGDGTEDKLELLAAHMDDFDGSDLKACMKGGFPAYIVVTDGMTENEILRIQAFYAHPGNVECSLVRDGDNTYIMLNTFHYQQEVYTYKTEVFKLTSGGAKLNVARGYYTNFTSGETEVSLSDIDKDALNYVVDIAREWASKKGSDGSGAELILWDDIDIGIYYSTPDKSVDPLTYIDTKTVK